MTAVERRKSTVLAFGERKRQNAEGRMAAKAKEMKVTWQRSAVQLWRNELLIHCTNTAAAAAGPGAGRVVVVAAAAGVVYRGNTAHQVLAGYGDCSLPSVPFRLSLT